MKKTIVTLNVLSWLATVVLAVLWLANPKEERYHPALILVGTISAGITAFLAWGPIIIRFVKKTVSRRFWRPDGSVTLGSNLSALFNTLNTQGVEYLVYGGFTALFYGWTRQTHDLDIWIGYKPDNIARLKKALLSIPGIEDRMETAPRESFRIGDDPVDLYFQREVNDNDFYAAYPLRDIFQINGVDITVIPQSMNRMLMAPPFHKGKSSGAS